MISLLLATLPFTVAPQNISGETCWYLYMPEAIPFSLEEAICPPGSYMDPTVLELCQADYLALIEESAEYYEGLQRHLYRDWTIQRIAYGVAYEDCDTDSCRAAVVAQLCKARASVQMDAEANWLAFRAETADARVSYKACVQQACQSLADHPCDLSAYALDGGMGPYSFPIPECPSGQSIDLQCRAAAVADFGASRANDLTHAYAAASNTIVQAYQKAVGALVAEMGETDCVGLRAEVGRRHRAAEKLLKTLRQLFEAEWEDFSEEFKAWVVSQCCDE